MGSRRCASGRHAEYRERGSRRTEKSPLPGAEGGSYACARTRDCAQSVRRRRRGSDPCGAYYTRRRRQPRSAPAPNVSNTPEQGSGVGAMERDERDVSVILGIASVEYDVSVESSIVCIGAGCEACDTVWTCARFTIRLVLVSDKDPI